MAPTTTHFVKSPMNCAQKRKLDDDNTKDSPRTSPSNKRCKRDVKKSKTTREQERLLLENFVKYGILSSPSGMGLKSDTIPLSMPSPISPIRTPVRGPQDIVTGPTTKENTKVRSPTSSTYTKKIIRENVGFWRPWLCSNAKNTTMTQTGMKDRVLQNYIALKRNTCVANVQQTSRHCKNVYLNDSNSHRGLTHEQLFRQARSPACRSNANVIPQKFQTSPTFYNGPAATPIRSSITPIISEVPRCQTTPSFTPTVKKWDTTSQEFLNSFKHPVK